MRLLLLFLYVGVSQVFGSQIIEKILCVESAFDLDCSDGKWIEIVELILGDSSCFKQNCCPKASDCRGSVSYDHKDHVNAICNGRQRCHFNVQKRNIGCYWYAPSNDYELIRYKCVEDPRKRTTEARVSTEKSSHMITFLMETTPPPSNTIVMLPKDASHKIPELSHLEYGTPSPQRFESITENSKFVNLEQIVIPAVAGVILTTLIISIACIVTKSIKLKYLRQKTINQDISGLYLQPISYQTLVRTCAVEENTCNETTQAWSVDCDTYDCIKDVCNPLEDGYLKPAEVTCQSSNPKKDEEDRYVLA